MAIVMAAKGEENISNSTYLTYRVHLTARRFYFNAQQEHLNMQNRVSVTKTQKKKHSVPLNLLSVFIFFSVM